MQAPSYSWSCHKCQASNPAGTTACGSCDFPAIARDSEIRAATQPLPDAASIPAPEENWLGGNFSFALFFPEAIPALLLLAASPFWLMTLLAQGRLLSALILGAGVVGAVFVATVAKAERSKTLLYVAMLVLLLAGAAAGSL